MINGAMAFSISTFNITVKKIKRYGTLIQEKISLRLLYTEKGVIYSCLELIAYLKF